MNSAIEHVVSAMREFHALWGIAGGWALDLFLGYETRPHADVDVAILRADQVELRALLTGRVEKVLDGKVGEWLPDERLEPPIHEVHVTLPDGAHLEFLLNESDRSTGQWIFRRDPRIRRSLDAAFLVGRDAPYLAPEIALLYKSKAPSPKDESDFQTVSPRLAEVQRIWLADALDVTGPGHPWAAAIRSG